MAAVAAAFASALTLGFAIRPRVPAIPDRVFGAVLAVVLVAIAAAAVRLLAGPFARTRRVQAARPHDPERDERGRKIKEETGRQMAALRERKRLRIAELMADPAKRKYVALVERGERWSDEQIAYHEDPGMTASCPHLQPIERGMRMAGIVLKLLAPLKLMTDCCIYEAGLRERFPLSEPVRYLEGYDVERHDQDNPWARLECSECGSTIGLVHPEWPRPTTKWFPRKPG